MNYNTLQKFILTALFFVFAYTNTQNKSLQESRPNIIFILTDDQGYGDLGQHGHPLLKTPNLDRLYNESIRFDRFYVSPSCSPTRAALMTGMHEFRNGVTHTLFPRHTLYAKAVTLPNLLKTAGYRNGFIGKWHLGRGVNGSGFSPIDRGFDWASYSTGGAIRFFDQKYSKKWCNYPCQGL